MLARKAYAAARASRERLKCSIPNVVATVDTKLIAPPTTVGHTESVILLFVSFWKQQPRYQISSARSFRAALTQLLTVRFAFACPNRISGLHQEATFPKKAPGMAERRQAHAMKGQEYATVQYAR